MIAGLRRAFGQPTANRGKVAGPIPTILSVAVIAFFPYGTLVFSRQLPRSKDAPKVGEKAPDLTLPDIHGKAFILPELLATPLNSTARPARGVLLVFYRGYW